MQQTSDKHFEHPLSPDALLPEMQRNRLLDLFGKLMAPEPMLYTRPVSDALQISYDLEPRFWLYHPNPELAALAAGIIEQVCAANGRYLQASALHEEVVELDFHRLQEQYRALESSEHRYRELSTELEQRVATQVTEIDAARQQLYAAEKLAAVGQLAAGLAHEINNPMSYVLNNCKIAADYLNDLATFRLALAALPAALDQWLRLDLDNMLSDFKDLIAESIEGSLRVVDLVQNLRHFSDSDRVEHNDVDINQLVSAALRMATAQTIGRCDISTTLVDGLPPVNCNAGETSQAVFNVILNAIQASDAGGQVRIATTADNCCIRVIVEDDGAGMEAHVLRRVFEPFFTTRQPGAGLGLGLTLAREELRRQGGDITLHSRHGQGTRVELTLPRNSDG